MLKIGRLYQHISPEYKEIYSCEPDKCLTKDFYRIAELTAIHMFVLLDIKQDKAIIFNGENYSPRNVYKILTTSGLIGWTYLNEKDVIQHS